MRPPIRFALAALLAGAALSACANTTYKQHAAIAIQAAESASGIAQDSERALYAAHVVPALDAPRHEAISRVFVRIFRDEHDAAIAMIAWRSGEPVPASVTALLTDASDAWAALQPLLADIGALNFVRAVQDWAGKVVALADMVKALVPPAARAAAAGGGR